MGTYTHADLTTSLKGALVTVMTKDKDVLHGYQTEVTGAAGTVCVPMECGSTAVVYAEWQGKKMVAYIPEGRIPAYSDIYLSLFTG